MGISTIFSIYNFGEVRSVSVKYEVFGRLGWCSQVTAALCNKAEDNDGSSSTSPQEVAAWCLQCLVLAW